MKIQNNTANGVGALNNSRLDKLNNKSNSRDVGGAEQDLISVDVSPEAQAFQKAHEIASQGLHDVDAAKVAHFQNLIDSGKYKVDAEAIADRLVDEHLAMPE